MATSAPKFADSYLQPSHFGNIKDIQAVKVSDKSVPEGTKMLVFESGPNDQTFLVCYFITPEMSEQLIDQLHSPAQKFQSRWKRFLKSLIY